MATVVVAVAGMEGRGGATEAEAVALMEAMAVRQRLTMQRPVPVSQPEWQRQAALRQHRRRSGLAWQWHSRFFGPPCVRHAGSASHWALGQPSSLLRLAPTHSRTPRRTLPSEGFASSSAGGLSAVSRVVFPSMRARAPFPCAATLSRSGIAARLSRRAMMRAAGVSSSSLLRRSSFSWGERVKRLSAPFSAPLRP